MKNFLVLTGIAAALMILVIAIATVTRPSREKKRKGETQASDTPKKRLWPVAIILLILAAGSMLISFFYHHRTANHPIAADAQDIWPQIGKTVKFKIYPNCWSGWINLPVDPSGLGSFFVKTPGETEIWFWSGERLLISDKTSSEWLRTIPHRSFRLRGAAGEAEITIE